MIKLFKKLLSLFGFQLEPAAPYLTEEEIEWCKCLDPVYFINNYTKYQSFDVGETDFTLYPFQEEMVRRFRNYKYNLVKSSRQSGKSIVPILYLLHKAIFNPNRKIGIASMNFHSSKRLLSTFKYTYKNLPDFIKPEIVVSTDSMIKLSNGSTITLLNSHYTPENWRNSGYTDVFLDEFAFFMLLYAEIYLNSFFHEIYPSPNLIITSTKNEGSYFNTLVDDSKNGRNDYMLSEYDWTAVPGRDEEWKSETISHIGETAFKREHEL